MPRQDNIIFQVQLLVVSGLAKFGVEAAEAAKEKKTPKYERIHCLPCGRTIIQYKDGWINLEQTICGEIEINEKHREKMEANPLPMERALTIYRIHQFNTLRRLKTDGVTAKIRLISYRFDEVIQEANLDRTVRIHARANHVIPTT